MLEYLVSSMLPNYGLPSLSSPVVCQLLGRVAIIDSYPSEYTGSISIAYRITEGGICLILLNGGQEFAPGITQPSEVSEEGLSQYLIESS